MWSTLSYNRIRSLDSWCPTYAVNTFNLRVLALFIPLNPPKCLTSKDFCFSAFLLRSNTELGKDAKRCSNRGWAHEQGEDVSCQPHHTPGKADPSIYVQENERHLHIGRTQSVALLPIRFWSISGLKAGFVGKKKTKKKNSIGALILPYIFRTCLWGGWYLTKPYSPHFWRPAVLVVGYTADQHEEDRG